MNSKAKYLIRLDDACPTMNLHNWQKIETILDKYNIKPMVGIIPYNEDLELSIDKYDNLFWHKARIWEQKKWTIALHGYNHVYLSKIVQSECKYLLSEFVTLSIEMQEEKIENGIKIFGDNGLEPKYFIAPNHTFDKNTLIALRNKSDIRRISDNFTFAPYKKDCFIYFPQQFGVFRKVYFSGFWTFCFHPNNLNNEDFCAMEIFIKNNYKSFISFDEIDIENVKNVTILNELSNNIAILMRIFRFWLKYVARKIIYKNEI